jgi:hypothetical protein
MSTLQVFTYSHQVRVLRVVSNLRRLVRAKPRKAHEEDIGGHVAAQERAGVDAGWSRAGG